MGVRRAGLAAARHRRRWRRRPAADLARHRDTAPNGARFLFLVDGADSARLGAFDRVFDLFDGNDEAAVAAARTRWSARRTAGFTLNYWQQTTSGWERKA